MNYKKKTFTVFNTILYWFFKPKVVQMISAFGVIRNKKTKKIIVQYARGSVPNLINNKMANL